MNRKIVESGCVKKRKYKGKRVPPILKKADAWVLPEHVRSRAAWGCATDCIGITTKKKYERFRATIFGES